MYVQFCFQYTSDFSDRLDNSIKHRKYGDKNCVTTDKIIKTKFSTCTYIYICVPTWLTLLLVEIEIWLNGKSGVEFNIYLCPIFKINDFQSVEK